MMNAKIKFYQIVHSKFSFISNNILSTYAIFILYNPPNWVSFTLVLKEE